MAVPIFVHDEQKTNNIVYQDTVLNLEDLGQNLKITTIDNVSRFSLEACLKTIFSSNPEVVFNTVQYSDKYEKVYFYTNREISIKAWKERFKREYQPLSNSMEILDEIKKILVSEKIKYKDCISLYDVAKLIRNKNSEYKNLIYLYIYKFKKMIESKYHDPSIIIYDFDYDYNELCIGFKHLNKYKKIVFVKKDIDLYLKESEISYGKDIFVLLSDELSILYDKLMKYSCFYCQCISNCVTINSNFLINIDHKGVSIYIPSKTGSICNREFELSSLGYLDDYCYETNFSQVKNVLKGHETELFKNIFVAIEDCPKWSQEILYDIRQKQLAEEKLEEEKRQKEENERQYQQMKKQKRLALIKKIFPFIQD